MRALSALLELVGAPIDAAVWPLLLLCMPRVQDCAPVVAQLVGRGVVNRDGVADVASVVEDSNDCWMICQVKPWPHLF